LNQKLEFNKYIIQNLTSNILIKFYEHKIVYEGLFGNPEN